MPISALMFTTPLLAAVILTARSGGGGAVKTLLLRAFDVRKIKDKRWLMLSVFTIPVVVLISWFVMQVLGYPLPAATIAWATIPVMIAVYFVGAIGEELGWMGYLIDPLRAKTGTLSAALIIGLAWGAWHIVPFYVMGRSIGWIAAQVLVSVLMRIIIVWLYDRANKSVFIAIVFHTFINVATTIIPVAGSSYDPAITAVLLAIGVVGTGVATRIHSVR